MSIDHDSTIQTIENLMVPNSATIKAATEELEKMLKTPEGVISLFHVMVENSKPANRQSSAVKLKWHLGKLREYQQLPLEVRRLIKEKIVMVIFNEKIETVRGAIVHFLGVIVTHESHLDKAWVGEVLQFIFNKCSAADSSSSTAEIGFFVFGKLAELTPDLFIQHFPTVKGIFEAVLAPLLEGNATNISPTINNNVLTAISALSPRIPGNTDAEQTYVNAIPYIARITKKFADEGHIELFMTALDVLDNLAELPPKLLNQHLIMEFASTISSNPAYDDEVRNAALNLIILDEKNLATEPESEGRDEFSEESENDTIIPSKHYTKDSGNSTEKSDVLCSSKIDRIPYNLELAAGDEKDSNLYNGADKMKEITNIIETSIQNCRISNVEQAQSPLCPIPIKTAELTEEYDADVDEFSNSPLSSVLAKAKNTKKTFTEQQRQQLPERPEILSVEKVISFPPPSVAETDAAGVRISSDISSNLSKNTYSRALVPTYDGKLMPLHLSKWKLIWDSVGLNTISQKSLTVRNQSNKPLKVRIKIDGLEFFLDNPDNDTLTLSPQEDRPIFVNFFPTIIGPAVGKLTLGISINNNNSNNNICVYSENSINEITIPLNAYGGKSKIDIKNLLKGVHGDPYIAMGEICAPACHLERTFQICNVGSGPGFASICIYLMKHLVKSCKSLKVRPKYTFIPPQSEVTIRLVFEPNPDDILEIKKSMINGFMTLAYLVISYGDHSDAEDLLPCLSKKSVPLTLQCNMANETTGAELPNNLVKTFGISSSVADEIEDDTHHHHPHHPHQSQSQKLTIIPEFIVLKTQKLIIEPGILGVRNWRKGVQFFTICCNRRKLLWFEPQQGYIPANRIELKIEIKLYQPANLYPDAGIKYDTRIVLSTEEEEISIPVIFN